MVIVWRPTTGSPPFSRIECGDFYVLVKWGDIHVLVCFDRDFICGSTKSGLKFSPRLWVRAILARLLWRGISTLTR